MSMTSQPVRAFPATWIQGNPPGGLGLLPDVLADSRPGLRDPGQHPVGCQVQDPADRGIGRRLPENGRELVQDGDVGHRGGAHRDRDRRGDQRHAPAELRECSLQGEGFLQRRGQAAPVGELAQQDPARVPDEAAAVAGHLQGVVPGRILHREERSSPGIAWCGNPQSFRTRALFALK